MTQRNSPVLTGFDAAEPGGGNLYPPTTQIEETYNFSDGSGPLFSMYLERADEEDKKMAESWKGDADGILVFTGLFSAAVATLLSISIQDLSQDTSAFYLANIYQLLSNQTGSQVIIPPSLSASFTPPTAAIWVNSLWFLSLVISLTCALLATLLQQWARRYLRITNPRCSPHRRARIRAFFAEGVQRLRLPWTVEALPTLLHISLFLFFAGLVVFLFGIHPTVFKVVIAWVGLCVVVYAYVTALPILHKDSPYHAPLSTFVWFCVTGMLSVFHPRETTRNPEEDRHPSLFEHSLLKMAEEHASGLPDKIDFDSLLWTFDSLDEDHELEKFYEGVPGFCNSNAVNNPKDFIGPNSKKLSNSLTGLMDRTLSSSLVSESVKQRRITICTKAMNSANLFGPWWILPRVLLGEWQAFLRSIDFGLFLKDWSRLDRPITKFYAKCGVAVIISSVKAQARDDRWVQLVTGQINVSKSVLRSYLTHGDSMLLANLVHIVQQTLEISLDPDSGRKFQTFIEDASSRTLESVCKLDVRGSLPELQHDFCKLWNRLVRAARDDGRPHVRDLSLTTLKNIRKIYVALHEDIDVLPAAFTTTDDSDAALDNITSYPICTNRGHEPTLHGGLSDPHGQATQFPAPLPPAVISSHVPVSSTNPGIFPTPSPFLPSTIPVHTNGALTDLYPIHNGHSAPPPSAIGTNTAPNIPILQIPSTLGSYATRLDP